MDYEDQSYQNKPPESKFNILDKRRDSHRKIQQQIEESHYETGINNYFDQKKLPPINIDSPEMIGMKNESLSYTKPSVHQKQFKISTDGVEKKPSAIDTSVKQAKDSRGQHHPKFYQSAQNSNNLPVIASPIGAQNPQIQDQMRNNLRRVSTLKRVNTQQMSKGTNDLSQTLRRIENNKTLTNFERDSLVKQFEKKGSKSTTIKGDVVFGGNNFIFCMISKHRRCFAGDKPKRLILSFFLINIPGLVFDLFVIQDICKDYDTQVFLIISIFLQFLTTLLMFRTGLKDPGVVPKNIYDKQALQQIDKKYHKLKTYNAKVFYLQTQNNCSIGGNAHTYKLKYCESCNIFRPMRTSHCHDCNNCVLGFDHHCVWLGTCIGKLNYTTFFHFVSITFMYIVYIIVFTILSIILTVGQGFDPSNIPKILLLVVAVVFLIMLAGLFIGHLMFMCYYKKTTNEALKRSEKYGYKFTQYQRVTSGNCLSVAVRQMFSFLYCRKIPQSLISNEMVKDMYKQKIDYIDLNLQSQYKGNQVVPQNDNLAPEEVVELTKEKSLLKTQVKIFQYFNKNENTKNQLNNNKEETKEQLQKESTVEFKSGQVNNTVQLRGSEVNKVRAEEKISPIPCTQKNNSQTKEYHVPSKVVKQINRTSLSRIEERSMEQTHDKNIRKAVSPQKNIEEVMKEKQSQVQDQSLFSIEKFKGTNNTRNNKEETKEQYITQEPSFVGNNVSASRFHSIEDIDARIQGRSSRMDRKDRERMASSAVCGAAPKMSLNAQNIQSIDRVRAMDNSIDSQDNARNKSLKYLSAHDSDGDIGYDDQVMRGSVQKTDKSAVPGTPQTDIIRIREQSAEKSRQNMFHTNPISHAKKQKGRGHMESSSDDEIKIDKQVNRIMKKSNIDANNMLIVTHDQDKYNLEQNIVDTGFSGESWKQAEVQSSFNNQVDASPNQGSTMLMADQIEQIQPRKMKETDKQYSK